MKPVTSHRPLSDSEPLLTPSEVAALFRVDPKTVTRWAKAGKLTSIRTLGGHRRYRESEVRSLLGGNTSDPSQGIDTSGGLMGGGRVPEHRESPVSDRILGEPHY
jgi:excisionase family DNA binding protein